MGPVHKRVCLPLLVAVLTPAVVLIEFDACRSPTHLAVVPNSQSRSAALSAHSPFFDAFRRTASYGFSSPGDGQVTSICPNGHRHGSLLVATAASELPKTTAVRTFPTASVAGAGGRRPHFRPILPRPAPAPRAVPATVFLRPPSPAQRPPAAPALGISSSTAPRDGPWPGRPRLAGPISSVLPVVSVQLQKASLPGLLGQPVYVVTAPQSTGVNGGPQQTVTRSSGQPPVRPASPPRVARRANRTVPGCAGSPRCLHLPPPAQLPASPQALHATTFPTSTPEPGASAKAFAALDAGLNPLRSGGANPGVPTQSRPGVPGERESRVSARRANPLKRSRSESPTGERRWASSPPPSSGLMRIVLSILLNRFAEGRWQAARPPSGSPFPGAAAEAVRPRAPPSRADQPQTSEPVSPGMPGKRAGEVSGGLGESGNCTTGCSKAPVPQESSSRRTGGGVGSPAQSKPKFRRPWEDDDTTEAAAGPSASPSWRHKKFRGASDGSWGES